MIQTILQLLVDQLTDYIHEISTGVDDPPVVLGNIGMAENLGGTEAFTKGRVVLSLVNVMEEGTLKNTSPYTKFNNGHEMSNPPTFLNLYLLFSSNFISSGNAGGEVEYFNGLTRLSQVITFFQSKNVFTPQNSPLLSALGDEHMIDYKIRMELFSLTFEQVNHLWGSLGGKQVPFVMYKASILPLKRRRATDRGEYIHDIHTTSIQIDQQ